MASIRPLQIGQLSAIKGQFLAQSQGLPGCTIHNVRLLHNKENCDSEREMFGLGRSPPVGCCVIAV